MTSSARSDVIVVTFVVASVVKSSSYVVVVSRSKGVVASCEQTSNTKTDKNKIKIFFILFQRQILFSEDVSLMVNVELNRIYFEIGIFVRRVLFPRNGKHTFTDSATMFDQQMEVPNQRLSNT